MMSARVTTFVGAVGFASGGDTLAPWIV